MKKILLYLFSFSLLVLISAIVMYQTNILNTNPANHHQPLKKDNDQTPPLTEEEPVQESDRIIRLTEDQMIKNGIEIETAAPGRVFQVLITRGKITLDPDKLAHIIPKVPGIVRAAKKNVGSQVQAGEVIAILESQEMADLKASYLAAASREQLASALLKREDSLYQKKISPEQDMLNARNSWEEARINLKLAIQKLQGFGLSREEISILENQDDPDLRKYEIRAPIDGTVMMRHLTQGEYVSPNSAIYEIADLSSVWVETAIYPKDLARVQEGQEVEVINLENQSKSPAKLIYISPTIAHESIAAKAIASLENPNGQWRPGLLVNMQISTGTFDFPIVIKKEALQKVEGCDCTFVQTDEGFEKREIKVGRSDHKNIEVLSGLFSGEKYVSKNPFILKAELKKDSAKDDD